MTSSNFDLIGPADDVLAVFRITDEGEGWYTGVVLSERLPSDVRAALDWYDEVVSHQMLSFLDDAEEAVQRFGLSVRAPDGSTHRAYSLHLAPQKEVSFRITPVSGGVPG